MQLGLELVKIWFESNFSSGIYAAWLRASEKFGSNQIFPQGYMQLGLELVKNLVRIKFFHRHICIMDSSLGKNRFESNFFTGIYASWIGALEKMVSTQIPCFDFFF